MEQRPPAAGWQRLRHALLVLLACAAGGVDAVSYVLFAHVFTANMTGNTVLLGLALAKPDPAAALRAGLALTGFLAGGLQAALMTRRPQAETAWSVWVTVTLGLEMAVLGLLAVLWHGVPLRPTTPPHLAVLIFLAALAMGLQSLAARRVDVAGIGTTYVTGTLTSLMIRLVDPRSPGLAPEAMRAGHDAPQVAHGVTLFVLAWLMYLGGALGAAVMVRRGAPLLAWLFPIALILCVVITALAAFRRQA